MGKYDSVAVIGGGSWGTTIAHLLAKKGKRTYLWLRDKTIFQEIKNSHRNKKYTLEHDLHPAIIPSLDMREVVQRSEIIIVAIPSESFREVAYQMGNYVQGDQILISACKGIDLQKCCTMSEVLKEETCAKKIGVLSGPNLSQEILKGHPAAAVLASKYHEVIHKGMDTISSPDYRIYGSEDIDGVELGGVVKNIIAIAAGMSDGKGFGVNTKALLVSRGINEMGRVGITFGANPLTFTGLAGLGDLLVTCSSMQSRNYRLGYYMAQGKSMKTALQEMGSVAEGVNATKILYRYSQKKKLETPIMDGIYKILYEQHSISDITASLMAKLNKFEIDRTLYELIKK
ncbi:MAG: NAD(P)-dependent glycerol-3-phosphate dehydrogenase [Planctomycetes bacterium]|jgi:glycerol-3-phosphate dehydrogenase (NAD(P)+)|nr:NAD(P)-dependent glycerol-3-phosphate dehydrogenase [Planctomycetota bacterium]HPY75360.1 NAD(P)H-dependent glycerol-3-phosphate dehydrogenase [Planctomycetota bacterium]HQB00973.1 NAD(P)H-dependent glycerol-3-phosphate dehydrogenase [Planctomycetota bacterium]